MMSMTPQLAITKGYCISLVLFSSLLSINVQSEEACLDCHGDDKHAAAIAKTPHGDAKVANSPAAIGKLCTSCHGASQNHLDNSDSPDVVYSGDKGGEYEDAYPDSPATKQFAQCTTCHGKTAPLPDVEGSGHNSPDESCTDCHDPAETAN